MLSRSLFFARLFFSDVKLKMDKFSHDEVRKMCTLLKAKYFKFNEDLQIFKDVRLLDEKGKLIGIYTPTQAYKKAQQTGKDLVVMNQNCTPIVCKLMYFKSDTINRFYKQLVLKNRDQILSKGNRVKRVKLSSNMSANDMKIKIMQILEIVKKQAKVMIFMRTSKIHDDEKIMQKMESVRNQLGQKVRVLQDVKAKAIDEEEGEQGAEGEAVQEYYQEEEEEEGEEGERKIKTYSIIVESSKDELKTKIQGMLKDNPQDAIKKFLKKYQEQEDQEMRSLHYDISQSLKNITEEGQTLEKTDVASTSNKTKIEKFNQVMVDVDNKSVDKKEFEMELMKHTRLAKRIHRLLD